MRSSVDERLHRLLAVLASLATNGPADLDALARRLQVSRHQLQVDLERANMCEIPDRPDSWHMIEVDFADDGTVSVVTPAYLERQPRLSRQEGFAVLATGRAALSIDPTLEPLASAMAKLASSLGIDTEVHVDLDPPVALAAFRVAAAGCRQLEIAYWSAWRDELTTRRVDPWHVFFREGFWYALCEDHHSGEPRRFRLDRIQSWRETGATFEVEETETVDDGIFSAPGEAVEVTVRFPETSRWITDYVDMEILDDSPGGGITATFAAVGTTFLERLLLRTAGTVVAPEALVGLTADAARRTLERYAG